MIPPSAAFIIYGALTETSVGALFAAGIVPGIMLAIMFSIFIGIKASLDLTIAPRVDPSLPLGASILKLLGIWPILLLIGAVLTPIFAGWSTATEASGLGALGAIVIGKLYGELTFKDIVQSVRETTYTFVMLLFVVCGAMILANSVALIGLPRQLTLLIGQLHVPPLVIIMGLVLMYLALGCLFDGISFLVMTLPFVFPIIKQLGFGGIWFGVLTVILIEIGQLTPPVGVNLYIIQAIAGPGTTLEEVVRGIWPFFWILLLAAFLIILFPQIATVMPALFGFEIN
jgi:tripartite ATP-independent transporter DctM subunit